MTYDYICEACGHAWEAQQSISEAPLKDCPACGEPKAKRQISLGGGFILKGGGWYSDLYSSAGGKPKAETSGSEASASPDKPATETKSSEKKSEAPPVASSTPATSPKTES